MEEENWALFLCIVAFLATTMPGGYPTVSGWSFFGYCLRRAGENNFELSNLIKLKSKEDLKLNGKEMKDIEEREYTWLFVTSKYAVMFRK